MGLLALLLLVGVARGKITDAMVKKDDRSLILMAEPFGFGADGRINITVSKFQIGPVTGAQKQGFKPNLNRLAEQSAWAASELRGALDQPGGPRGCARSAHGPAVGALPQPPAPAEAALPRPAERCGPAAGLASSSPRRRQRSSWRLTSMRASARWMPRT